MYFKIEVLEYTADEFIGKYIWDFSPDESDRLHEKLRILTAGEAIQNVPFKFRTKSGADKYLIVDSNVALHEDGSFKHTRCFLRDDTL